jgi:hypothetical protein
MSRAENHTRNWNSTATSLIVAQLLPSVTTIETGSYSVLHCLLFIPDYRTLTVSQLYCDRFSEVQWF